MLIKLICNKQIDLSHLKGMRLKTRKQSILLFTLLLLLSFSVGVFSISSKVLYPVSSNMDFKTDYYMSFSPDITYSLPDLNVKLTIPIEYDLSQISNEMECYFSKTGLTNSYLKMTPENCFAQPNTNSSFSIVGQIIIKIDSLSALTPLHFVFRNILNPKADTSSFFGVEIRSSTHLLESDKQFKMLTFTPGFATSTNGISISTNPLVAVVGQGTTYYFKLKTNVPTLTAAYSLDSEFTEIRVVFPKEFYSSNAICSLMQYSTITGTYAAIQVQTSSTPSKSYSIECKKIQNFISSYLYYNSSTSANQLYLKIQNIVNPVGSSTFNNLYLEISRGGRNQIIERVSFPLQPVQIKPEQLDGEVKQSNKMRNATTEYFFYMTHDLTYQQNSKIRIYIGNNTFWQIHDVKLMFGFTEMKNFTSKTTYTASESIVEIQNYGTASTEVQQVIALNLTSSNIEGDHKVKIQTLIDNKVSGTWEGIVNLNYTWGSFNRLSFSAVQQPTKLSVAQTGPLEFTLFMNYELPESQHIQNGSMIIKMTPPIPTPDPDINGKVKCFFKATKQAADCIYDNTDPTKTVITIVSPPYDQFQYSQIPITITTEGGIDQDHLGLMIDPMVKRYKFDVEFFLYNSSTIPSEVLYTNWLADAIDLGTAMTAQATSYQVNELTALHFTLITPLMTSLQQRLLFQFMPDPVSGMNAWHPTLGFNADKIYKEFPCVVVGFTGLRIRCDLYTYVNSLGPYNKLHIRSKQTVPFIMVYGFEQPIPIGSTIKVYLPGIKLSNSVGADALVSFSILQETPGDTEPYIELYNQKVIVFKSITAPSVTTSSQPSGTPQIQVQTSNLYTISWNPFSSANVAFIRYDFTKELPSIDTLNNVCSGTCYSSGYPNNWIVQIPSAGTAGSVLASHTLSTTLSILSMPYIDNLVDPNPVKITTYNAAGRTLQKINVINNYIPQVMSGAFNLLSGATIYSGLKQWYQIEFTTGLGTTSTYPFIRLKLSSELQFASPEQCLSTTILPFNQTGIRCTMVPGTSSHQILVWNIKQIDPSITYQIQVRLQTTAPDHSANINPKVDVYVNHNQTLVNSYVHQVRNVPLVQVQTPIKAKPQQFTIHNPQILNQEVRVNYIGRLFIDFDASTAMTTHLKIRFPDHRYNGGKWSTPNQPNADPMVCMLNNIRFYCSVTYAPLTIIINSAVILSGHNRLQLDTEYVSPYNGLVFPLIAGNYQIFLSTIDPVTSVQIIQHTFYAYIHPPPLEDIQVASIVKDIGTESVYILNFTIADAIAIPPANHAAGAYSRIFVEFPTIVNGQRVFLDNLGGYTGYLNERVGCAFLKDPPYVAPEATKWLECRLIPPEIPGAPVKVEVINFDTFSATLDSMGLYIFKVFNPATAFNSVEIKVKINKYMTTGEIYPLFQSDYLVFLDPRTKNPSPQNYPSSQSQLTNFFDMALDVGDPGKIQMKAQLVNAAATLPFYMLVKLPPYLPVVNDQLSPAFASCPTSNFQFCVSAPQINYVLVKTTMNPSFFQINIEDYPISISQQDSKFYSMIVEEGRYVGNIEYIISEEKRWLDIRGDLIFGFIEAVGLIEKTVVSKQRFEVQISFTTANYIPATGTIEISFPASVTKIYPYCRSAYSNGSALLSQSGASGQVGCAVQNTNKWVITGFAQVLPGSIIMISGHIDLPTISGTLGLAQIITYSDSHPTDIYTNGSQIDYVNPYFSLMVDNVLAMNPNQNVFLTQRDVVRAGDIAQFRLLFKLPQSLTTTGHIKLDLMKTDINGNAGGFVPTPAEKQVCEFIDITNENRIGCEVTLQQDLTAVGQSFIRYTLKTYQSLLTTTSYQLRLTTQKYSNPNPTNPQGLRYPSIASTYKIDFTVRYSSAVATQTTQHLYLDVYGPQFSILKVTQHNYIQNQYNPYWFEITPSVIIKANHQIVVEFPTLSNDGTTTLFTYNLGLTEYVSGDEIAMDVFESTIAGVPVGNDFMKCHIYHGNVVTGLPVKVICGKFLSDIAVAQTLRFAIGIINPPLFTAQLSIPLMIYSFNPYNFIRTQFNLVNGAGYIYDTSNILAKAGYPATTSMQMEYEGDDFLIGDAHTFDLLPGDSFIMKFGFPIRVNGKVASGCTDLGGTVIYGDAYYHQRLRTVVCKIILTLPAQLTPAATRLMIKGFYTPWYYLAAVQQKLYAISHYYSTSSSQVVQYTDLFPNFSPRYTFTSTSSLVMQSVLLHNTICQRDDYVFTIQLDPATTGNFNLQYTKMVAIVLPLQATIDFVIFSRDCVEHTTSSIEVKLCEINQVARTIYIEIVPGTYGNDRIIAIQTKGLALRNPCLYTVPNINQFKVDFYSWQNITESDKRAPNRVFMTMDVRNLPSLVNTYVVQASNAVNSYFYPFDWVEVPHERYFAEFHQFKADQYSPFKFDLVLTTAIGAQAIGSYNTLTLYYGDKFDVPSPEDQYIEDMKYNTELCYLRSTRVAKCENDFANKKITMYFEFELPTTEWINVYFSIQNPTNKELNGFEYIGSDSDMAADVLLQLKQFGAANSYIFKANPFEAKQTNFDPATTQLPERAIINADIDYANSLTSQLNVIDMTFYLNTSVSDIRGLKFQIPMVDEFGSPIFTNKGPAFMDLEDGDEYPCGNNDPANANSGRPKCYLFHGNENGPGEPASIIMTDFKYTTQIKARLIMRNPATAGVWFTIIAKAYKGLGGGENSLIGHKYVGYWRFYNVFQTVASAGGYTSASGISSATYLYPSNTALTGTDAFYATANPLWMDTTTWVVTGSTLAGAAAAGQYIIFQAFLNDYGAGYTQPQFCQADWTIANTFSDDMLIYKNRQSKYQKVFFIKKWTGAAWSINYFKCKHYLKTIKVYYHSTNATQGLSQYTIPQTPYLTYPLPNIRYYEVMQARTAVEIDLGPALSLALTRGFNWQNEINYAMRITTNGAMPWDGFTAACYPTGGFQNLQGDAVTCTVISTTEVIISNFNKLLPNTAGQYNIRFDITNNIVTTYAQVAITATVYLFAGPQAFTNTQYFLHATSNPYTRAVQYWSSTSGGWYYAWSGSFFNVYNSQAPTWVSPNVTIYNNYYYGTNNLMISFGQFYLSATVMTMSVTIQPTVSITITEGNYEHFVFRFVLQGVSVNCGSITSLTSTTSHGGAPINLLPGAVCAGKNHLYYSSYTHSNAIGSGTYFGGTMFGMGAVFQSTETITFNIGMNVAATDPSWTREWVGVKVFLLNSYLAWWGCCDNWLRYKNFKGYGQGFLTPQSLFTSGVTVSALSNLAGQQTQLQVAMKNSIVPIGPTTTDKLLLLQFNQGSTLLFPYLNNTATILSQLIQCYCIVSAQPDFSGAIPYTNLNCYHRMPVSPHTNTAITIDIILPVNSYVKCYFPGFVAPAATVTVTAKIINQGISKTSYPSASTTHGGLYATTSPGFPFSAGSIPNIPTVTQTPDIYAGTTPVKIKTLYSSGTLGGYSLAINMGVTLTTPIFYLNFGKAGPVADTNMCAAGFQFCRVYSKYRNILIAKTISNVGSTTFSFFSASVPKVKQPNLGSDYNLKVYVKQPSDVQYTYSATVIRANPSNLIASTTIMNINPDRLTSLPYQSFTSNLIITFKLQSHQLISFYQNKQAKIQISYDVGAYISSSKGCLVSTDLIADDSMFYFYCEVDAVNKVIKIQNRQYNNPFSGTGMIQVVVGVTNQAATTPITFTLRMYKWYYEPPTPSQNYGLLIEQSATYTPTSVAAGQLLQYRYQLKQYPFYTRVDSHLYAPFRIAFKFPSTMTTALSYVNDLTSFMILDQFDKLSDFSASPYFQCLIKQYTDNPNPLTPLSPKPQGYRNYKQNNQYYLIPTYCSTLPFNATALRIEIPRNRILDNTKYYELVVMPISPTMTGFPNFADPLAKLVVLPATSAEHIFETKVWAKGVFSLGSFWLVTTRPQAPTAIQFTFTTSFPSTNDFPAHYLEITFNDLPFSAIQAPYDKMGGTVPCSFSSAFQASAVALSQKVNCIVAYADKKHDVIKIRVQNFKTTGPATFQLSFDDFLLPDVSTLLQKSNSFSVCMTYWSTTSLQQRCFGELFVIDGYTNTVARSDLTSAAFLTLPDYKYGATSSPIIQLSYPKTTTTQRHQKVMIKITGGYSANNPAPLSFTGSNRLWYNPMINLYIQKLNSIAATTTHQIVISGAKNPYPYQMQEYMDGCQVDMTYFQDYHPHTNYLVNQPAYPLFIKNMAQVKLGSVYSEDIKTSVRSGTDSMLKLTVDVLQTNAFLTQHQDDRFQIQFATNVNKVKRCWVTTQTANVQYSQIAFCTPKPTDNKRIQLMNFFTSNTGSNVLIVYVILQVTGSPISVLSHLYAVNDQEEFESPLAASISSVSNTMLQYAQLTFTESHYTPGYYEQIITPVTHTSTVEMMYLSMFLPQKQVQLSSIFTIFLNPTIAPVNIATSTRLVCQWMKVNKYGRTYETGKFSHCNYVAPNIVINAPTWHLEAVDGSGVRIPYLLKIRQQSPTSSLFTYPTTSLLQQIILQSDTGGIFKKDTLRVRPYQHFNGLSLKYTTLTINQLNTYTVQFATPTVAVGAGQQYVLTLQIDNKYMPDTLGVKDIYDLYGDDAKNESIINNLNHSMVTKSLPNKWVNGIPYSCYTSQGSAAEQTTIAKSDKTIRVNLLLGTYTSNMVWKIPLLKNPSTQKPLRMNLTLWSYPASTTQGHKQLFYQIINQHATKISPTPASLLYDIQASTLPTNIIQTAANSLNVEFPSYTPTISDTIELKLLARAVGLIDLLTFTTPSFADTTSFDFYYFENLNFVIAQKKLNDGVKVINFGAAEISNTYADDYGYEWVKVHSVANRETIKVGSQLIRSILSCSISTVTYTLKSGLDTIQNGKFEATFSFTTPCIVPVNSTLRLSASTSDLQFLPIADQAYCETTFRSMGCWVDASKILHVRIDQVIAGGILMQITTFVKSKSRSTTGPIQGQIYAIPDKPSTLVNTIASNSIFLPTTATTLNNAAMFPLIIKPLYQNTYTKLTGTFITGHLPFTYLNILSPFQKIMTSNQTFYYQSNSTGSPYGITQNNFNQNWIKAQSTVTTGYDSTQTIVPNGINSYAVQVGTQYRFVMGSMYQTSADLNNFLIGPVGTYYQFQYNTDKQIAYHQVYPLPVAQKVTVINPLTQVGQQTVLGIEFFSLYQSIQPGDKIQIQLDAHNLIEDMYTFTDDQIQCIEFVRGVLTNNIELVCEIAQYPDASINRPMILHVYPTNTIAANTVMKIWISPIINSVNVLVAGVTVKVLRPCSGEKLCTIYEGRGWYETTSGMTIVDHGTADATFTPAPTTVLSVNSAHTFAFTPSLALITSFAKYPQNYQDVMPLTCTTTGTCLVFPKQRKVVTVKSGVSIASLAINGMTNGIYIVPQDLIDLKLASATALHKYTVVHNPLTTRQIMPLLANAANTFTIINTQNTGAIFLRNYWNTVKMQIKGLYTSEFIKAFYIVAPPQVTQWDTTYCNATIASSAHLPYPTRLQCLQITPTTIQIKIPEGVSYNPSVSQTQLLTIHARFWLVDYPAGMDILYVSPDILSGNFNAYGSFKDDDFSTKYYITQAFTPIWISRHKTPLISKVEFNTESFEERLASVNDQTTFQILMDPITTDPVDFIELVIPEEFKYPNVLDHDMCELIYRRVTELPSCRQTRKDNQTIITIDVDHTTYDNGPRILQIASKDPTNWFTAPSLPGQLYNMTISLYGLDGRLLQKQSTKNSSRIKGYDLRLNNIIVQNGHDELQYQIYDVSFRVGSVPIKQGYRGILSNGEYYSELRIKFQTVEGYDYWLGNHFDGERLGCVTSLKSINKQISCIFDYGTNINDQPMIIIRNYEQIDTNTLIKISLANIKNLPATLRNTLAIQVKYYKVGDQTTDQKSSFYMYQPTQAITDVTTALNVRLPTALAIAYLGQTIVNEPTTLKITLTPETTISSYIVLKFPKNGLRDEYSRFNVQCLANCLKVEIFYRAEVVRIYPIGGSHPAGVSRVYELTGFPSTEYAMYEPNFAITLEGYAGLKLVNRQTFTLLLNMQGCLLNSGIIAATSPYGGDTGVSYTFQAQVNASQLSRSDEPKQLNMMIKLPSQSTWFSPLSSCTVELPLYCSIDMIQKRIIIKNLLSYTKSTVTIRTFNIINPSLILTQTNLTFTSSLFQQTLSNSITQENTICLGSFSFMYLPSPPNKCALSLKTMHQATVTQNTMSFGIVCEEAIRNSTSLYIMLPREITFNNPTSSLYKCWTSNPAILLDSGCQIVFINGTFYFKTVGQLNIVSNVLQLELNIVLNNPLTPNTYTFGSSLEHSGNFYSVTNNVSLVLYTAPSQTQLNSSIELTVIPQQAGAQAIYVVKVPTQVLSDKMSLNFGNFGVQLDSQTKISYYQPQVNATTTSLDATNWLSQQSYFTLLQNTYRNQLTYSTNQMYDFSQQIMIDTSLTPKSQPGWTYIILSPIINPSSSTATDTLSLKLYNKTTTNTSSYNTLISSQNIPMNLNIENPPANVYQVKYSVVDNDVLTSTQHTVAFTMDHELYANQDGKQNIEVVIDPPTSSLKHLASVQACLYYPTMATLVQCGSTIIGERQLSFKPTKPNLIIAQQTTFFIVLKNVTNPENQTFCDPKIATEKDYLASYFQLKIFIDAKLQYQSNYVGMIDDSNKPCVEFKSKKGDILHNLPQTLFAGFQAVFNVTITQPTANLRVFLKTNDTDLVFSPDLLYFNSYGIMLSTVKALVSPNAVNKSVEVSFIREETLGFNSFRAPQAFVVKIVAGQKETVTVNEMQSSSVGYDIKIPIQLSKSSVTDMVLLLTPQNSTATQPYLKFFTFSTLQVLIPAFSTTSYFTIKYNGTVIPSTLPISLKLISQSTPTHSLLKQTIYLYFSIDPKYQSLPPIMKMNLLWLYKSNKDQESRTVYYCCDSITNPTTNEQLRPVIIDSKIVTVTATKVDVQIWTRNQATLFYQLREKGKHFELQNITSIKLRTHSLSQSVQTLRNSTKIVNAFSLLNFTGLQHQTEYLLYVSAFDPFGDSENVTVIKIKTAALSRAIKFNLNCFTVLTNEVMIVKALADILKIDMRRIKVVSSEKNLMKTYTVSSQNKPIYAHEIVISPSLTDDSTSPEELFKTRLLNNPTNQGFLKEKIPSWTGNFGPVSQYAEKRSFYEVDRVKSEFKQPPTADRISYYNATLKVKLWGKSRVHAVMIVEQRKTPETSIQFVNKSPKGRKVSSLSLTEQQQSPNSKQILKGLNQYNTKLPAKYTFSGLTNDIGQGSIFFSGLKPGSYCKVYITATNPQQYEPIVALPDGQVYVIDFNLLQNPNLKGNNHVMLNQLKKKNEKMYNVIKEYYENQDNSNKKSTLKKQV